MTPVDAIKLDHVQQPEYGDYGDNLCKPGNEQNDNRYGTTQRNWSVDAYRIGEIRKTQGQPAAYTLQEMNPDRTFTKELLQIVSQDRENLE